MSDTPKNKVITKTVDNNTFVFTCEECEGKYLDTRITLNGNLFCWITFSEVDNFINDFSQFMAKYRI